MKAAGLLTLIFASFTLANLPAGAAPLQFDWGPADDQLGFYAPDDSKEGQDAPMGPLSLAVDAEGSITVADTFNRRIKKFSISGRLISSVGTDAAPFEYLGDLRVLPDKSILVIDQENQQIVKLSDSGQPIQRFGGRGEDPGRFVQAHLLGIGPDGTIFVGDRGKINIQLFKENGTYLKSLDWNMNGFCVTAKGQLLELDYDEKKGYSLVERDPASGARKLRFEIGLPERVIAFVVGEDDNGNVTCSFCTMGSGDAEFMTFAPDGKKLASFSLPIASDIRGACVMGLGKIFCFNYSADKAPKGKVEIQIR